MKKSIYFVLMIVFGLVYNACVKQDTGIITDFFNYPNPFNPTTESTTFKTTYTAGITGDWVLSIYSENGDLVYEDTGSAGAGGTVTISWAGRDNHGNPVHNGVYKAIFTLDVTDDGSGNKGSTFEDSCRVVVK